MPEGLGRAGGTSPARRCRPARKREAARLLPELRAQWNFFLAYNLFRIAAILQGIAKRAEAGIAASASTGSWPASPACATW